MTLPVANYYGSDAVIELLKAYQIEYVACNPGATFRGIQDSLVNHYGNDRPKLITCCHEEIAVAIAHGYAKATGKIMAVLIHSNVGLQHASMAIFNAWCDRVPLLVLCGVGPLDSSKRRPWIDWIHTAPYQANIIADFVKWHDQPHHFSSFPEAFHRAMKIGNTMPKAPVYLGLDTSWQEEKIDKNNLEQLSEKQGYISAKPPQANADDLITIFEKLTKSTFPVVITDYSSDHPEFSENLIQFSETFGCAVIDRAGRLNFPTRHFLNLSGNEATILKQADFILALDVQDLWGALGSFKDESQTYQPYVNKQCFIVQVSLADYLVSQWAADYQKLSAVNLSVLADTSSVLRTLLGFIKDTDIKTSEVFSKYEHRVSILKQQHNQLCQQSEEQAEKSKTQLPLAIPSIIQLIGNTIAKYDWVLTHIGNIQIGQWVRRLWDIKYEKQYLGFSGGAGLGYGLGASIGASLPYKNKNTLCINLQTDGDLQFTPSALWTAAHCEVPLLIIVMNNRAYGNTLEHAHKIAQARREGQGNKEIGSSLNSPIVNYVQLANAYQIKAIGPVENLLQLESALKKGAEYVFQKKKPFLIDVVME